jgi:hypothetical protein
MKPDTLAQQPWLWPRGINMATKLLGMSFEDLDPSWVKLLTCVWGILGHQNASSPPCHLLAPNAPPNLGIGTEVVDRMIIRSDSDLGRKMLHKATMRLEMFDFVAVTESLDDDMRAYFPDTWGSHHANKVAHPPIDQVLENSSVAIIAHENSLDMTLYARAVKIRNKKLHLAS